MMLCHSAETITDMQVIPAAILMFAHVFRVKLSIQRDYNFETNAVWI